MCPASTCHYATVRSVSKSPLQVAAAFALGADGVALGTRLVPTYESVYPEDKKQALLLAGSDAYRTPVTIRTSLYDQISGEPWPSPVNGHCLRNNLTAHYQAHSKLEVSLSDSASASAEKGGGEVLEAAVGGGEEGGEACMAAEHDNNSQDR